jgi:hypothetical protein
VALGSEKPPRQGAFWRLNRPLVNEPATQFPVIGNTPDELEEKEQELYVLYQGLLLSAAQHNSIYNGRGKRY